MSNSRSKSSFTNTHKAAPGRCKPRGTWTKAASILFLALGANNSAVAWSLDDLVDKFVGPSKDDVEVSFSWGRVPEKVTLIMRSTYQWENTRIFASIRNNSEYYLTAISCECDFFDREGNRLDNDYLVRIEGSGALRPNGTGTWFEDISVGFSHGITRDEVIARLATVSCELVSVEGEK